MEFYFAWNEFKALARRHDTITEELFLSVWIRQLTGLQRMQTELMLSARNTNICRYHLHIAMHCGF